MSDVLGTIFGGVNKPEVSRRKKIEQAGSEAVLGIFGRLARGESAVTVGVKPQAGAKELGIGAIVAIAAVAYVVIQGLKLKK